MFGGISGWGWGLDLEKALDSTTAAGQALIPQIVDPYIVELAKQHAPLRSMIPRPGWKSGTYDRNKRTAFGRARFIADGTSAPETQSTYVRFAEPLKILQGKGGVTGFLQASGQQLLDANRAEIDGATIAATYEEEWGLLYANKYADPYMWSGLEQWNQTGNGNIYDAAGATVSAAMLDQQIDTVQRKYGTVLSPQNSFFMMSYPMQSKFSATLQSGQRWNDTVEVAGGFRLQAYRNIPILPTSFIAANQAWAGGVPTATPATSGGSLADATYKYYITAVLLTGETITQTTELSATVSGGGGNGKVTIVWTAIPDARLYKIWRTTGSANSETLYTVIPANAYYDSVGLGFVTVYPVDTWVDTGVRTSQTVSYNGGSTTAYAKVTAAAYTPTTGVVKKFTAQTDTEDIWLCTTMAPGIEGGTLEVATLKDLSYFPLAKIADKEWFLIVEYAALICVEQFQARITNAKIS